MPSTINGFLKNLRAKTGSTSIKESRYGDIHNWISTGSMALNRIISGSIKKGIPSGRITVISGESSTGKSLIAALIIANALKAGYDHIFYFDSEGGGTAKFFENVGADTDKIEQILVENIEDAQLKILEVYNGILELKQGLKDGEPEPKFLCVLDSLGALVAEKVLRDADKGKVTSEMGGRAKQCLPAETLVLMSDNTYKEIKDIIPGDTVITHLGKVEPVLDNFKSHHTKYIKIKLKDIDEPLKMSLDHRMLVSRNNELIYCTAQTILPTDKLVSLNL